MGSSLRRRRRRSSFGRNHPERRWIAIGAGAFVLIGAFIFFIRQADVLAPEPREIRVELPDAFKE
ncbi:hypothetical protein U91I_01610 [alpha proteobacterium U9-1i]|nr:hypothetical protein U91I_01610 [alpha proteobacterium U9-1i]